jgi:small redox-active disulfide protein 2
MIIKVLGPGCPNCKRLEKNMREAVKILGLDAEVVKVTDLAEMMKYGMMGSPGLVIDDELVSTGKVMNVENLVKLLSKKD